MSIRVVLAGVTDMVTDAEWKYFLDCLNGNKVYSLDEKLQMTDKNSIGGSV